MSKICVFRYRVLLQWLLFLRRLLQCQNGWNWNVLVSQGNVRSLLGASWFNILFSLTAFFLLFIFCPTLSVHFKHFDTIFESWKEYKQAVPTFGGILLDPTLQFVSITLHYIILYITLHYIPHYITLFRTFRSFGPNYMKFQHLVQLCRGSFICK